MLSKTRCSSRTSPRGLFPHHPPPITHRKKSRSLGYGGHGVYGVRIRERKREGEGERRGYEPLALHAPIHQAILGVCDQNARWTRSRTRCSSRTSPRGPFRHHRPASAKASDGSNSSNSLGGLTSGHMGPPQDKHHHHYQSHYAHRLSVVRRTRIRFLTIGPLHERPPIAIKAWVGQPWEI